MDFDDSSSTSTASSHSNEHHSAAREVNHLVLIPSSDSSDAEDSTTGSTARREEARRAAAGAPSFHHQLVSSGSSSGDDEGGAALPRPVGRHGRLESSPAQDGRLSSLAPPVATEGTTRTFLGRGGAKVRAFTEISSSDSTPSRAGTASTSASSRSSSLSSTKHDDDESAPSIPDGRPPHGPISALQIDSPSTNALPPLPGVQGSHVSTRHTPSLPPSSMKPHESTDSFFGGSLAAGDYSSMSGSVLAQQALDAAEEGAAASESIPISTVQEDRALQRKRFDCERAADIHHEHLKGHDAASLGEVDDARTWSHNFQSMTLRGISPGTQLYESTELIHTLQSCIPVGKWFKVSTPFPSIAEGSAGREEAMLLLQQVVSDMRNRHHELVDCGLISNGNCEGAVVSGVIESVHVDSSLRVIAELDVEDCCVSLADVLAFGEAPMTTKETLAVLKSVMINVAVLHESDVVHGTLHSGNVLLSTNDGHSVLSQPCDIMSAASFPTHFASLSPNIARHLRGPALKNLGSWSTTQQDWEEKMTHFTLEALQVYKHFTPADDLYAMGSLALEILVGFPIFHGYPLRAVIDEQVALAAWYDEQSLIPSHSRGSLKQALLGRVLGDTLSSIYCRLRICHSQHNSRFVDAVVDFAAECILRSLELSKDDSSADASHAAAELIRSHDLFVAYSVTSSYDTAEVHSDDSEDEDDDGGLAILNDVVHRLAYPIYLQMECATNNSGTPPYLPCLHRNAIFTSRMHALNPEVEGRWARPMKARQGHEAQVVGCDTISGMWPLLDALQPSCWRIAPHQSSLSSSHGAFFRQQPVVTSTTPTLSPPRVRRGPHSAWIEDLDGAIVVLHRTDPELENVEVLILRQLRGCTVVVMSPVRFLVIDSVVDCNLRIGPCVAAYISHLKSCSLSTLASFCLVKSVSHSTLRGIAEPSGRPPFLVDETDGSMSSISVEPYDWSYAGLTEDCAAVGYPVFCDSLNDTNDRRDIILEDPEHTAHDFPYAHSLLSCGRRFVHRDDNVSDVFLYRNELAQRDVLICGIYGFPTGILRQEQSIASNDSHTVGAKMAWTGVQCSSSPSSSLWSFCSPLTEAPSAPRQPVIFLLDKMGDVVIHNCRDCVIAVLGAASTVTVTSCTRVRVLLLAKEVMVSDCTQSDMHLFVTEGLSFTNCTDLVVSPLCVDGPYVDEVLENVVESTEADGDYAFLHEAYAGGLLDQLNVVLQGCGREVDIDDCEGLLLHDLEWYASHPNTHPTMWTLDIPCAIANDNSGNVDMNATSSEFFASCSGALTKVVRRLPLSAFINDQADVDEPEQVTVRLHDLSAVSMLRLPGSIHLRSHPDMEDDAMVRTRTTLVLERIYGGVIQVADSVELLYIRHCHGPLDIAVGAAQEVVMECCTNVVVRVACKSFRAFHCHLCHVALHVNEPPHYVSCSGMCTSALNMTSANYEDLLTATGIALEPNLFERSSFDSLNAQPCTMAWRQPPANEGDAWRYLLSEPVTLVAPLPGVCLGIHPMPFLEELEKAVTKDEACPRVEKHLHAALALVARSDNELPLSPTSAKERECLPTPRDAVEPDQATPDLSSIRGDAPPSKENSDANANRSSGRVILPPPPSSTESSFQSPEKHSDPHRLGLDCNMNTNDETKQDEHVEHPLCGQSTSTNQASFEPEQSTDATEPTFAQHTNQPSDTQTPTQRPPSTATRTLSAPADSSSDEEDEDEALAPIEAQIAEKPVAAPADSSSDEEDEDEAPAPIEAQIAEKPVAAPADSSSDEEDEDEAPAPIEAQIADKPVAAPADSSSDEEDEDEAPAPIEVQIAEKPMAAPADSSSDEEDEDEAPAPIEAQIAEKPVAAPADSSSDEEDEDEAPAPIEAQIAEKPVAAPADSSSDEEDEDEAPAPIEAQIAEKPVAAPADSSSDEEDEDEAPAPIEAQIAEKPVAAPADSSSDEEDEDEAPAPIEAQIADKPVAAPADSSSDEEDEDEAPAPIEVQIAEKPVAAPADSSSDEEDEDEAPAPIEAQIAEKPMAAPADSSSDVEDEDEAPAPIEAQIAEKPVAAPADSSSDEEDEDEAPAPIEAQIAEKPMAVATSDDDLANVGGYSRELMLQLNAFGHRRLEEMSKDIGVERDRWLKERVELRGEFISVSARVEAALRRLQRSK